MRRMLLMVIIFLLPAIMMMISAAPLTAQTSQPNTMKIPNAIDAQKTNPVKPPVYPPSLGHPQQPAPARPPVYKPSAQQQTNKPNSTYVVKQNQDSPARVSCLAKCEENRKKYRADCNKSPDPVEESYCVKRGDSTYN
ncbi:MAG: hypothetical protein KA801_18245, partial [Syntrophorhabdaceae bacterium]|nr:hypothetical protein [Syntrophorhabdaceae bacterium]